MIEFEVKDSKHDLLGARIKVIGVGGGGSNAVNSMVGSDLEGVKFIVANTDVQALAISPAELKIQVGKKITKGLGSGSNPDIGRRAAEEELSELIEALGDADIVFLAAGMGGGTGTGATPVIARAAREMGILTVAIVTKPFLFEGKRRLKQAEAAIAALEKDVDTLIIVPNEKLLEQVDPKITMLDAFSLVNNVLKQAIKGVSEIITKSGHINVDFADVRSIMKGMGLAIMGTGRCRGEGRAKQAALEAISSPLLENVSIAGAQGVLINITGDASLGLYEINDAVRVVYDNAGEDANIIFGSVIDPTMGDEVMVTIIASGFEKSQENSFGGMYNEPGRSYQHAPRSENAYTAMKRAAPQGQDNPNMMHGFYKEPLAKEGFVSAHKTGTQSSNAQARVEVDVHDLDAPTYLRKKAQAEAEAPTEL